MKQEPTTGGHASLLAWGEPVVAGGDVNTAPGTFHMPDGLVAAGMACPCQTAVYGVESGFARNPLPGHWRANKSSQAFEYPVPTPDAWRKI